MTLSTRILVVDDEESMRFFLSEAMQKEGYQCVTAVDGSEALCLLEEQECGVVLLDYSMPGLNGIETFQKIKKKYPDSVVILMTAFGNKNLALEAVNQGIFDFFTKPFEIEEMRVVIRRAVERWHMQTEIHDLKLNLKEKYDDHQILGESEEIKEINERIRKVGDSDVSVLILGESGTGKELIAHALHNTSGRREGPFVKVNCAAVPHDLLEAEFFGHEKGAFTGAHKLKRGKFEVADGGTLFLDEIGDMPTSTQMKILRAIQEQEFERLGGEIPIKVDVRIISATNKNLTEAVADGSFREDLFYRLNVVSLNVPPLRVRKGDISILADHFLSVYNEKFNKQIESISKEGMDLLLRYSWPGNIRELENVIQRGIVLAYNDVLCDRELLDVYPSLSEVAPDSAHGSTLQDKLEGLVTSTEKRLIQEALTRENWKRQETADRLGISRKSLHNKMKKYGLMN